MNETKWVHLETVSGDLYPEMIRGLLESNGIPVILSQEGAGKSAYHVTVGPLSEVEIIVPTEFLEQARSLVDAFYAGDFENTGEDEDSSDQEENPPDQG